MSDSPYRKCANCGDPIIDKTVMVTGSPTRFGGHRDDPDWKPHYCCRWCREVLEGW